MLLSSRFVTRIPLSVSFTYLLFRSTSLIFLASLVSRYLYLHLYTPPPLPIQCLIPLALLIVYLSVQTLFPISQSLLAKEYVSSYLPFFVFDIINSAESFLPSREVSHTKPGLLVQPFRSRKIPV